LYKKRIKSEKTRNDTDALARKENELSKDWSYRWNHMKAKKRTPYKCSQLYRKTFLLNSNKYSSIISKKDERYF
jgi:hypothetical protein